MFFAYAKSSFSHDAAQILIAGLINPSGRGKNRKGDSSAAVCGQCDEYNIIRVSLYTVTILRIRTGYLGKIIKIYHEFVDRVDNSVSRVTVWHHEALLSDAKQ